MKGQKRKYAMSASSGVKDVTVKRKKRKRNNDGAPISVVVTQVDLKDDFVGKDSKYTYEKKKKDQVKNLVRVMPGPSVEVIRAFVFKRKRKKKIKRQQEILMDKGPTENETYTSNSLLQEEVPEKYWAQRKRYFKLFDQGVKMDKESWFSVTPEAIAMHTAQRVASMALAEDHEGNSIDSKNEKSGLVVLDAFCGCGGNAIAFARQTNIRTVVCIDNDIEKLRLTANNAAVYGVPSSKLVLIHADCVQTMCIISKNKTEQKDHARSSFFNSIKWLVLSQLQ